MHVFFPKNRGFKECHLAAEPVKLVGGPRTIFRSPLVEGEAFWARRLKFDSNVRNIKSLSCISSTQSCLVKNTELETKNIYTYVKMGSL